MQDEEGPAKRASAAAITERGQPGEYGATLPSVSPELQATAVDDREAGAPRRVALPAAGYQLGEVLGRGGMGEVLAAHDRRIGREVALKRMRAQDPDDATIARFLHEARIQARLDHPAIVPVHELGIDREGLPFFTMKRLAGSTLARHLADGTSRTQLLRAFVDVCFAIDFAHSRGIVHRDLKPSNIMLGEYGEVYVLDWGIAYALADGAPPTSGHVDESHPALAQTATGALLGTPGYMAPEQLRGEAPTPAADVYALGATLFELLAGPLHPRGGPEAIASTLDAPQESPARRRPEANVPPELDAVCFAALAAEPAKRPMARQLAERVQAYLDGDRDLERRRTLAAAALARARTALAEGDRAAAVQLAGRALALDPESEPAGELVASLIVEPPEVLPPSLEASLSADERRAARERIRQAVIAYMAPIVLLLCLPFVHVTSWPWLVALLGQVVLVGITSWQLAQSRPLPIGFMFASNLVTAVLFTRLAGPFVLTPVVVTGMLVAFAQHRWLAPRPWALFGWALVAVLAPFGLEAVGVLAPTWSVDGGSLTSTSRVFGEGFDVAIVVTNALFVLAVGYYALELQGQLSRAQRTLYVQAWHLRHLLPDRTLARPRGPEDVSAPRPGPPAASAA